MNLIPRASLFENWFDRDFPGFRLLPESRGEHGLLAVDIRETDKAYQLKADFPGLKKEEISVTLDNGVLTLSAEHKEEKEEKEKGKVIRKERRFGSCSRSFTLGAGIDETAIVATFADGVLALDLPKAAPSAPASKQISIK